MNLPEWNEDLNSLEAKTSAKKLSLQQKLILLVLLDQVKIWYSVAKESHKPEWFRQASIWGFSWKPGNNRETFFKFFGQESEWSASKRASWSKSLAKLEYRGLIIRNNYNCEPRLSTDTPPPKRTTAIKLTYLGYRIANLVDTQDSVFPVKQLPKCLDSPKVRKATRKLSRLQKRILSVLEFRMQIVNEENIKFYNPDLADKDQTGDCNPDLAHYIDDLGFPWWLHPSEFYEKSIENKSLGEYTSSDRSDLSRSLKRLENRGLIIRNNYKNLPQKSNKIAAPKYSTHIKITDLGRKAAQSLMKGDPDVSSYGYTKLSSKQRKQLVEQIKKRLTK